MLIGFLPLHLFFLKTTFSQDAVVSVLENDNSKDEEKEKKVFSSGP